LLAVFIDPRCRLVVERALDHEDELKIRKNRRPRGGGQRAYQKSVVTRA
jgi:hypothetical protein